ncbi:MAG: sugar ABC transporter ATP-binding protein, partial [Flavihumibacter sp.]
AGKSTLMNIIAGNLQPDTGNIFFDGKETTINNVLHAQSLGISIMYQERSLADALSVAENIFPVQQPKKFGLIDHRRLYKKTKDLLDKLQIDGVSPRTPVSKLSAAQKGMVEIAKALAREPAVLILDEPTASITHEETAVLFSVIRNLKQNKVAVIYISHRMAEIREIADRVTVLKDGQFQGTVNAGTPVSTIVKMMVGRELAPALYPSHCTEEVLLNVQQLTGKGFENISFTIHKGEIVGFAGLTGSGRTALARALFGDAAFDTGRVQIEGSDYRPAYPGDAVQRQVAYLPDDRKQRDSFSKTPSPKTSPPFTSTKGCTIPAPAKSWPAALSTGWALKQAVPLQQ